MLIVVVDALSRDAACSIKLEWRFIGIMKTGFQM
jgi:hypothetical protein